MKKGRLTKEEHAHRIKSLLIFIYTFRYATRKQLEIFIQVVMDLTYTRRLIDYSIKENFINAYYEPLFKTKIYYLTYKGKEMICDQAMVEHYYFEKSHAGLNTFIHHNNMIEAFIILKSHLNIKEWVCEWDLRRGKRAGEKIPDGLITFTEGINVALEVETRYKTLGILRNFVKRYRYDIEKISRYHCVLVVASSRFNYDGLRTRLYNLAPEFCSKAFILADLGMLELGMCFYQGKLIHLEEAVKLLKVGGQGHGQAL
ncbi:MAG: replication-relaxation family protein [Candidatus Omnitrophica bacterium]|nr:replication-relaxation family protein [Candidatus Omnitrophota bacterium]